MKVEQWLRGHFHGLGSQIELNVLEVAAISPMEALPSPMNPVNLDDGILQREVAGGDESEGIVDVSQAAFVEFGIHVFQDNLVDPVEGCRIATEDGVRQHVLLYAASALQEGAFSDAHTVLYDAC